MIRLLVHDGEVAVDGPGHRLGGIPLVAADFGWPSCATCGHRLQFLAQLRLEDIGAGDSGLLSLFVCRSEPGLCDEFMANEGGNAAFVFDADALRPATVPPGDYTLTAAHAAMRTVAVAGTDDYEQARGGYPRTSEAGVPVLGQLGGAPEWIQFEEVPDCPACETPMTFVVQLEEGVGWPVAMNFGGGCGYGFRCRTCPRAAFLYQT